MDDFALNRIFSLQSAAWTGILILFLFVVRMWNGSPAMFAQWIEYRKAKEAAKASDWTRLRDEIARGDEREVRRDERIQKLEVAETKCREELAAVKEEVAQYRGYQVGLGHAHQEAAGIVALERKEKP